MKNDTKKPAVYQENGKWYFFKRKELKNAFDKAREENGQSTLKMIFSIAEGTDIPEDTIRNHLREDDAATFPRSIEIAKNTASFLPVTNTHSLLVFQRRERSPRIVTAAR